MKHLAAYTTALLLAAVPGVLGTGKLQAQSVEVSQSGDDIEAFCTNIANPAREQRYALKEQELLTLQEEVEERIAALEAKRAEFETWVKRRENFAARAQESVVGIYAKMRPDAAASRLEMLNDELVAAIVLKLSPRQAGVILNEMKAHKAASVTALIAASARRKDPS